MFKHVVAIVLMLPATLHAQEFWHGLRWGMTKEEIVTALPSAVDYTVIVGGKPFKQFGLAHYDIGGCDASVGAVLKNGHLSSLWMEVYLPDKPAEANRLAQRCQPIIDDGLTSKYGPPAIKHVQPRDEISGEAITWLAPNARISRSTTVIQAYKSATSDVSWLLVMYQPRDSGAAGSL